MSAGRTESSLDLGRLGTYLSSYGRESPQRYPISDSRRTCWTSIIISPRPGIMILARHRSGLDRFSFEPPLRLWVSSMSR
jgi:hypothetical protein